MAGGSEPCSPEASRGQDPRAISAPPMPSGEVPAVTCTPSPSHFQQGPSLLGSLHCLVSLLVPSELRLLLGSIFNAVHLRVPGPKFSGTEGVHNSVATSVSSPGQFDLSQLFLSIKHCSS